MAAALRRARRPTAVFRRNGPLESFVPHFPSMDESHRNYLLFLVVTGLATAAWFGFAGTKAPTYESVMEMEVSNRDKAIRKMENGPDLARLAAFSGDPETERAAFDRLKESSVFRPGGFPVPEESLETIVGCFGGGPSIVRREALVAFATETGLPPSVRKQAFRALSDDDRAIIDLLLSADAAITEDRQLVSEMLDAVPESGLERLCRNSSSPTVRQSALERIRDVGVLDRLAANIADSEFREAALSRRTSREREIEEKEKKEAARRQTPGYYLANEIELPENLFLEVVKAFNDRSGNEFRDRKAREPYAGRNIVVSGKILEVKSGFIVDVKAKLNVHGKKVMAAFSSMSDSTASRLRVGDWIRVSGKPSVSLFYDLDLDDCRYLGAVDPPVRESGKRTDGGDSFPSGLEEAMLDTLIQGLLGP